MNAMMAAMMAVMKVNVPRWDLPQSQRQEMMMMMMMPVPRTVAKLGPRTESKTTTTMTRLMTIVMMLTE